jgi:uncharacterized protein
MSKNLTISNKLSLPLDAVTQTFAILAKRRVGKTYTASVIAEEMAVANLPFVAVDPTGAWWGLRASADGKGVGIHAIILGGAHGDIPIEFTAGKLIAELVVEQPSFYILDLSESASDAEQDRFATDFFEKLYRLKEKNRSPLHLFIDEADMFAPQKPFPGQTRMLGAVEALIRRGGIRGIGTTLITQRPAVLNKNVLTQTEVMIVLQTTAPQDQDAIKDWASRNGTKDEVNRLMSSLASLKQGDAWIWSPAWLEIFKLINIRARRTFNSSATLKVGDLPVQPAQLAEVDVTTLRKKMAATIERIKADDPKALRQQIAQLEREVRTLRAHVCPEAGAQQAISDDAEKRLTFLIAMQKEDDLLLLEDVQRQVDELDRKIAEARNSYFKKNDELLDEMARFNNQEVSQTGRKIEQSARSREVFNKRFSKPKPVQQKPAEGINKPQQAILDALAWFEAVGINSPSRSNVAAMAGIGPRSSGYRANVSTLSARELLGYPQSDCLALTEKGRGAANAVTDLVRMEDLHQAWLNSRALSQPQKHLLQILLQIYPKAIAREQPAAKANVGAASSGYRANISTLSGFQLVVYPSPNMVQANAEILFPAGLQ